MKSFLCCKAFLEVICLLRVKVLAAAQVGRAGRDGQEAQCHLFLDDADFRRLHSLSNSDAVAQSSVQAFLEAGFQAAEDAGPRSDGDEEGGPQESLGVAVLAAQETSRTMDLKPEVMETLLSYLEVQMLAASVFSV